MDLLKSPFYFHKILLISTMNEGPENNIMLSKKKAFIFMELVWWKSVFFVKEKDFILPDKDTCPK